MILSTCRPLRWHNPLVHLTPRLRLSVVSSLHPFCSHSLTLERGTSRDIRPSCLITGASGLAPALPWPFLPMSPDFVEGRSFCLPGVTSR